MSWPVAVHHRWQPFDLRKPSSHAMADGRHLGECPNIIRPARWLRGLGCVFQATAGSVSCISSQHTGG